MADRIIDTMVAGTSFAPKAFPFLRRLKKGLRRKVQLRADPKNRHDPNAVKVVAVDTHGVVFRLGYVPMAYSQTVARALRSKRTVEAVLTNPPTTMMRLTIRDPRTHA